MPFFKKCFLFCLGVFALHYFCQKQTDGFALSKIQSNLKPQTEWETVCPNHLSSIAGQPFYYLGHGAQTFAFVSKDDRYVLKFYRHHRTGHPLKACAFFLPYPWKNRLAQTLEKRLLKRLKDFSSYKLAYDKLQNETGLLCLHLNKTTTLNQKVTLYDKIGVQHVIDLDQMEFILQEKASLLYPTLEKWISCQEIETAKQGLSQLISLLRTRCQRGIFDKDADLKTNFGFIDNTPIQFDIGRFKPDPSRADPEVYREDLFRITDKLCQWLETRAPELVTYIQTEIKK